MQHWFAGFSPLTGILVLRHCFENPSTITGIKFQSPYGDFGTATLSLSTRSLSGLSGDFFKPKAFFALFGDPGEK